MQEKFHTLIAEIELLAQTTLPQIPQRDIKPDEELQRKIIDFVRCGPLDDVAQIAVMLQTVLGIAPDDKCWPYEFGKPANSFAELIGANEEMIRSLKNHGPYYARLTMEMISKNFGIKPTDILVGGVTPLDLFTANEWTGINLRQNSPLAAAEVMKNLGFFGIGPKDKVFKKGEIKVSALDYLKTNPEFIECIEKGTLQELKELQECLKAFEMDFEDVHKGGRGQVSSLECLEKNYNLRQVLEQGGPSQAGEAMKCLSELGIDPKIWMASALGGNPTIEIGNETAKLVYYPVEYEVQRYVMDESRLSHDEDMPVEVCGNVLPHLQ